LTIGLAEISDLNLFRGDVGYTTGQRTETVPVTRLADLHFRAHWWIPRRDDPAKAGRIQRWMGEPESTEQKIVFDLVPEHMSIVRAGDLDTSGQPYIPDGYGTDTAFVRVYEHGEWGVRPDREVFLPCIEIMRYHYSATPQLVKDVFSGDILLKPPGFRYPTVTFDGCAFRSLRKPRRSHRGCGDLNQTPQVRNDEERYAYEQLRAIAWNLIASQQLRRTPTVEAFPPFVGKCLIWGPRISVDGQSGERTYVSRFRIVSRKIV